MEIKRLNNRPKKVGRPKGSTNKKPECLKRAIDKGNTPLQYFQRLMNDPDVEDARRDAAARACLPYVHPKLQQIAQVNVNVEAPSKSDIDGRLLAHGIDPADVWDRLGTGQSLAKQLVGKGFDHNDTTATVTLPHSSSVDHSPDSLE